MTLYIPKNILLDIERHASLQARLEKFIEQVCPGDEDVTEASCLYAAANRAEFDLAAECLLLPEQQAEYKRILSERSAKSEAEEVAWREYEKAAAKPRSVATAAESALWARVKDAGGDVQAAYDTGYEPIQRQFVLDMAAATFELRCATAESDMRRRRDKALAFCAAANFKVPE